MSPHHTAKAFIASIFSITLLTMIGCSESGSGSKNAEPPISTRSTQGATRSVPATSATANSTQSSHATSSTNNANTEIAAFTPHQFKKSTLNKIQNSYAQLLSTNQQLQQQALAFCRQTSTPKKIEALKNAWHASNNAWQYIQTISFGPVNDSSRRHDIAYYPVTKSTLQSKITALVESDTQHLSAEYLAEQPASLQGLTALEYLVFREEADTFFSADIIGTRYCDYVQAIGQRLVNLSLPVNQEWQAGGIYYTTLMSELSTNSFNEALFGAINERLSIITNDKILKVQTGNTSELESAYAQVSLANIKNNMAFVRALYDEQGILAWLNSEGHTNTALTMHSRLSQLDAVLDALGNSLTQTLALPEADAKIDALLKAIHNVHEYHARTVAEQLNIFIGFSGADGD